MRRTDGRILVIDDDVAVLRGLCRCLTALGYSVETSETGTDALAKLRTQSFGLAIVDLKMPGMDGCELAARIKAEDPRLPVFMLTSHPLKTPPAGVDRVLSKPASIEDLSAAIRLLLDRTTGP